jgi:hypothetical protein
VVDGGAEPEGEGGGGGGDAEGDLGGVWLVWFIHSINHCITSKTSQSRREWEWERGEEGIKKATYQISQRIQLLTHKTRLLPPARDLAVHEVEEQAQRDEAQRPVQVRVVVHVVLRAVPQRREHRHDAAEAVQLRDEIRQVQRAHQREVARVLREEAFLLVFGWRGG